ncbi:MAG: hypothetical protein ABJA61_10725, partial [Caldimonas sp.]
VIEAPGDCSPSRKVVSKMNSRSVTADPLQKAKRPAASASGPVEENGVDVIVQRALTGRRRRSRAERIGDITGSI